MKTKYLFILFALIFAVTGAYAQSRGQITSAATPAANPMNPNGDGFVTATGAPFLPLTPTSNHVNEFELKMFGLPKVGGDVPGDNQTGPNCGGTDLIPDTNGYSVYAAQGPFTYANNTTVDNVIFRFRLGSDDPSVLSWHILLDVDNRFGIGAAPQNDPNATASNPGFELDITLITKNNPGVFITFVDGASGCPNPYKFFPLTTNFQISVADLASCSNPDYFYDFFVPVNDILAAYNTNVPANQQIVAGTGFRYVATTSTSATCNFSGSPSDIGGIDNDDPLYQGNDPAAYAAIINNQCPTAVISLCNTCDGFNTGVTVKPTINSISVGDQVVSGGTNPTTSGVYVKLSVYSSTGPGTWAPTPREEITVFAANGTWSVPLAGPLQNLDRIVAKVQLTSNGISICDGLSANSSTAVTIVSNFRPNAVNDNFTTNEEVPVTFNILSNDTDPNGNNTINGATVDLNPATPAEDKTLVVTGQGTYTVNSSGVVTFTPVINFNGPVTPISYTVKDNAGAISNPAQITGTVTNVNDAPVAVADTNTTLEDNAANGNVISNDTDIENNPLTVTQFTVNGVTTAAGNNYVIPVVGSLIINSNGTYVFTPATNYDGPVPVITYTISDGNGGTASSTLTLTITPQNDAPVANADAATTNEDVNITFSITNNDTDADAAAVVLINTINPASVDLDPSTPGTEEKTFTVIGQGVFTVNNTGQVTFNPQLNYFGITTITYTVKDTHNPAAVSAPAQIQVTVLAVIDFPIANNDAVTTDEDVAVQFSITANDTDPDGTINAATVDLNPATPAEDKTLTITGVGTYAVNISGLVTFTPVTNFNGSSSISYTVKDNEGNLSNTAQIQVTVTPVNDPPVAVNDLISTPEDVDVTFSITNNDTDVDGNSTINVASVDLDPSTPAEDKTRTVTGQGVFTVDLLGNVTFAPAPNYFSPVNTPTVITYTVKDNNATPALSNVAEIRVTVTSVNDAPVAVNDTNTTLEDNAVSGNVLSNDTDTDNDALTVTQFVINSVTYSAGSTATITGVGTLVINSNGSYTFTPALNYDGVVPVATYTVTDTNAGTDTATLTITITPVNDPPVAVNDAATTDEDNSVTVLVPANDTDVEGNGTINVASVDLNPSTPAEDKSFTVPGQGQFTVDAQGLVTFIPVSNYNGTTTITYTIKDNAGGLSNQAQIQILVNSINDVPVASSQVVVFELNTPKPFTLGAFDNDNDPLTYTLSIDPLPHSFPGTVGIVSGTAPSLTFTPDPAFAGTVNDTFVFTFTVTDNNGATSNVATITLRLNDLTPYPPDAFDQSVSVNEDSNVDIQLVATDRNGNSLTYEVVDGPDHGTLSCTNCVNPKYTPFPNYFGPDSFTFRANDGALNSNVATVSITVNPVNDAPIANSQSVEVDEDIAEVITLTGSDIDPNTTLTYSIVSGPTNGVLSCTNCSNPTYTPNGNYNGNDSFTFRVNDGNLFSAPATVSIVVKPVNDPPVANAQSVSTDEDTALPITLVANDPIDGDALTYAIVTQPAHGTLSCLDCDHPVYTPNLNYFGPDSFTFKANDGADSNIATVSITVNPVNDAPIANNQSVVVDEDTPKVIQLTGSDVDPNTTLTFFIVVGSGPTNGTLSCTNCSNPTYTPNTNYNGPDSFSFRVNDGSLNSVLAATVSITVVPINDNPVAVNDNITTDEDVEVEFSVTANDTDTEGNGSINVASVDLNPSTPVEDKTFTVANEGVYTVDNLGNVTFVPALNYNGTATPVTYTVKDNTGALSNNGIIQVTVLPVNDAPVVTPTTKDVTEDVPTPICFEFTDIENNPAVFSNVVSLGGNGTVIIDNTAGPLCFLYTPDPDYNGPDQVQVTICDANTPTLCSTGVININVLPVNDPPRIIKEGVSVDRVDRTTPEDTPLTFCFEVVDPDGDLYTGSVGTNIAGGGSLVLTTPAPGQLCLTFAPALNFNGKSTWPITICDDANPSLCGTFTIEIDVTPVNDVPLAATQNVTTVEETPVAITLSGSDVDGDALTYTIVGIPLNGILTGTGANVSYTPNLDYTGPDNFTFKVNDGTIDSDVVTVNINVTPQNDKPIIIAAEPDYTTEEDTPVEVCFFITDPDAGDVLTFSNPVNTAGGGTMTIGAGGICFNFTPAKDFNGESIWKFEVCDNGNPKLCSEVTVTIVVTPVNDPPVAVDDNITVQGTEANVSINLLDNDFDVDGDDLVITTTPVVGPFHGTITINADGTFKYQANEGYVGADSVRYRVCDNGNPSLCDEGVLFIDVDYPKFKIYNALSPNNDGLNDHWRIDGIENYPDNRARVFDRYNNLIFEMSGYDNDGNSWRGQANHGNFIKGNMPEGTYFYTLEVDLGNGKELFSGYLVLKKE